MFEKIVPRHVPYVANRTARRPRPSCESDDLSDSPPSSAPRGSRDSRLPTSTTTGRPGTARNLRPRHGYYSLHLLPRAARLPLLSTHHSPAGGHAHAPIKVLAPPPPTPVPSPSLHPRRRRHPPGQLQRTTSQQSRATEISPREGEQQAAADMSSGRYMAYSPSPSTTPHSPRIHGLRTPSAAVAEQEK